MDNKLTKSRLSNLIAYDWIFMLVVIIVAVVVWEVVYAGVSAKLTVGQKFSYYYDEGLYGGNDSAFSQILEDDKTFSYDVLDVHGESLNENFNVLTLRLSVQDADIMFSSIKGNLLEGDVLDSRATGIIDTYGMYAMEDLLADAKAYVSRFLVNDDLDNPVFDDDAIKRNFLERMKSDNRYRAESAKREGVKLEKERIAKLVSEVSFFEKLLEYDNGKSESDSLFFSHVRYSAFAQTQQSQDEKDRYAELAKTQTKKKYGLKIEKLVGGQKNASDYLRLAGAETSKDVVLMVFDFKAQQPDLQFETISFINTVVRRFGSPI